MPWMGHWPTTPVPTKGNRTQKDTDTYTYAPQQDVNLQPQCAGSPESYTITPL